MGVRRPRIFRAWSLRLHGGARSSKGKASVIIAALLEKRKAAPRPWTILKDTSSTPDWDRLQSAEAAVKRANPSV